MIHEINEKFDHIYQHLLPQDNDFVLMYHNNQFAGQIKENKIELPRYKDFKVSCLYLFSIEKEKFFLSLENKDTKYCDLREIRYHGPKNLSFAIMNGFHIHQWLQKNKYCGCCGNKLKFDEQEFMLHCPHCQNTVYPRINPAVNICIIDKNRLLLAKHGKDKPYALISGFVEYGESLEDTIVREVKEEVGLKVKNIRYFGSQPWGFAQNLQVGFVCELDGSDEIVLETNELYDARFFSRESIINQIGPSSITGTMIQAFIENKI